MNIDICIFDEEEELLSQQGFFFLLAVFRFPTDERLSEASEDSADE